MDKRQVTFQLFLGLLVCCWSDSLLKPYLLWCQNQEAIGVENKCQTGIMGGHSGQQPKSLYRIPAVPVQVPQWSPSHSLSDPSAYWWICWKAASGGSRTWTLPLTWETCTEFHAPAVSLLNSGCWKCLGRKPVGVHSLPCKYNLKNKYNLKHFSKQINYRRLAFQGLRLGL